VVADIVEVRAEGEGDLAQLLDLILVGDFVSLHLAAQEGIDPGPVPVLDEIKQRLRRA
jgi:glucose/mannose-6-phosphate isomerase